MSIYNHQPEMVQRAREAILKIPYYNKSKRFWVSSLGIDGVYYGSYQPVDQNFLNKENYTCYSCDYEPAFLLHNYRHIPSGEYYNLYKDLEISNNRGLVNIKEQRVIDILKKHGIEI